MSGQLLLFLLTSVLAADESGMPLNRNADGQHSRAISQSEIFSTVVAEESRRRKRVLYGQQQLSESQKTLMEHVELSDNWSFWYDDATPEEIESRSRVITSEEWLNNLTKMDAFRSYGQFLNQVKTLDNKTKVPARIYLFKANIRPLWEDEANKDGGKLIIGLPDEPNHLRAFEAYLKVAVKVMCSSLADRVCGITFAAHPQCGATISVWTPTVWTPHRDRENFNRFKRLIAEEEEFGNQGQPLKVVFRPHKTSSSSARAYAGGLPTRRVPYRNRCIRPPPGFEGSAPDHPLSQWFNIASDATATAAQPIAESQAPSPAEDPMKKAEEEAEMARRRKEEEEAEAMRMELLKVEAQKKEEEAKARKLARRQRQKENRKKRRQGSGKTDDAALSDSSSDDEPEEEQQPVLPAAASAEQQSAVEQPAVPEPKSSGYGLFVPVVATVSACAALAAPLLWQYLL